MKYLINLWTFLSNLGINNQISQKNRKRIKICNQSLTIGLFSQILLLISNLLNTNPEGYQTGTGVILFVIFLLYLNYINRFQITQLIINTAFPLVLVALGVLYGENGGVQYNFMLFIMTALFFNQQVIVKLLFVLYNLSLYVYLRYYWINYESIYADKTAEFSEDVGFISTAVIIVVLLLFYENETEKYDKDNQNLLSSLEKNNTEITKANKELERFAYIASHDLKTPLRTILGYTKLIEKDLNKKDDRLNLYFEQIKKGALQMNDLIKSTLEYSRVNNNVDKKLADIDLNVVLDNIQNTYINNESVVITKSQLPIIYGEEHQIFSLFQNLIENGVKYNEKAEKRIDITYEEFSNKHLIKIQDNGIGIDEKYFNQVFTMFKRLHTNQQYEGTGLGLAICKKVVDMMNGKLWIKSKVGLGTTFYIELPKASEEE